MVWVNTCACFRLAVYVARRVHPLETATAKAIVKTKAGIAVTSQTFQIRGLAPNGKDFSPGGTPALSAWVSLPRPADGDEQHYCAWLKTVDNLGVPGIRVKFVVHFLEGNQQWTSAPTGPSGIVCTQRSVGNAVPDYKVPVDVYAAGQHVRVSFTPRAAQ
jgi:hypothetical protein